MESRQGAAQILNGRPWTSSGPPVGLYHPVFDNFFDYFKEPSPRCKTASSTDGDSDNTLMSVDDVFSFMRASSEYYRVERSGQVDEGPPIGRVEAVLPVLARLLGVSLVRVANADLTEPDARATTPTLGGCEGLLALIEFKLESGVGGDGKVEVQQSYARTCSLPDVSSSFYRLELKTQLYTVRTRSLELMLSLLPNRNSWPVDHRPRSRLCTKGHSPTSRWPHISSTSAPSSNRSTPTTILCPPKRYLGSSAILCTSPKFGDLLSLFSPSPVLRSSNSYLWPPVYITTLERSEGSLSGQGERKRRGC